MRPTYWSFMGPLLLPLVLLLVGCTHPMFRVTSQVDTPVEALGAVEAGITAAQDTVTARLQEHAITLEQAEALEDQLDQAGRIADDARAALAAGQSAEGRIDAARALLMAVERRLREEVEGERAATIRSPPASDRETSAAAGEAR